MIKNNYYCKHNYNYNKDNTESLIGMWPKIPYYNETALPVGVDPTAGSWPLNYFKMDCKGNFYDLNCEKINLSVRYPDNIDYYSELDEVKETEKCLINQCDQKAVAMARFWGTGVPVSQWSPIVIELINAYKVPPPEAGRIMNTFQATLNDAFVITWYYKYLYNIPRPCQLDEDLKTVLNTPRFPAYPSGHSVVSGVCEVILSYYFPNEGKTLKSLADDASISRLYGGIHFRSDLSEGLDLGRRIGLNIVNYLKTQLDCDGNPVDHSYTKCYTVYNILPPYYPCQKYS